MGIFLPFFTICLSDRSRSSLHRSAEMIRYRKTQSLELNSFFSNFALYQLIWFKAAIDTVLGNSKK
ncbi:hypothetical protein GXM_06460 [Nostoc sphaeroides CCNUC1]|uniref:Uncharacterized protein n=1 Tax=Nostoc sphaeroides CCNUC1 TaxID=2653204 RepID=A0A5P8W9U8_9NOSO|nr:hypothetical protein GXM_06460 [Nostoc sphaeroides CCNUC1]